MFNNPEDKALKSLLSTARTIAVVGLSDKPQRDSHRVAKYLQEQGYRIIPVNPVLKEVLGEAAYPDLASVPVPVDIVNIFRRSEEVPGVVDAALANTPPEAIWMQLGVVNEEAAKAAVSRGVTVVMDRCIKVEHGRLLGGAPGGERT
ncbi:CoA-binding protein [Desulfotomaculum copahuensis]|uniref:CoA-binding protein n=1 Tax=Desulfotomaculum copahuensis TaxID=1838280 RepID=A0A1B7LGW3_9FIRM|nr:CoA-binding protein [Desulfotomaculum copahuensis]OAT85444.1 CoA-binding protein [Desulfotomaculum copahuensis]